MKNYYEKLNLDKNCSAKDIKDSFIELSKKYHPDRNKTSEAHKKFVEVNEAYSVLSKTSTRQAYDSSLAYGNQRVYTPGTTARPFERRSYNNEKVYKTYCYENSTFINKSKMAGILVSLVLLFFGSGMEIILNSKKRKLKLARYHNELKKQNSLNMRKKKLHDLNTVVDSSSEDITKKEK